MVASPAVTFHRFLISGMDFKQIGGLLALGMGVCPLGTFRSMEFVRALHRYADQRIRLGHNYRAHSP